MNEALLPSFGLCCGIMLLQILAAIPWLFALDPDEFRSSLRLKQTWLIVAGVLFGGAAAMVGWMQFRADTAKITFDGQVFCSILHAQIALDVVLIILGGMMTLWPKGGTVAMAAFRESYRQPMFWVIVAIVNMMFVISLVIPYYTFGEDFRMMKQISFDIIKLSTALFVVLAAAMSISEEIEGRTAVTLMSKPVTRRQFLLGKYFGILLAGLMLTLLLGWFQNWALHLKPKFERLEDSFDPLTESVRRDLLPLFKSCKVSTETGAFLEGIALWVGETLAGMNGLALGFGSVMVMLAISASFATRMSMVVTVVVCLILYLLGNLAPILVSVSENLRSTSGGAMNLVSFLAQLLDKMLPALSYFNTDQIFMRDMPLEPGALAGYVGRVMVYSCLYSAMALLVGLFLVEDRDLA